METVISSARTNKVSDANRRSIALGTVESTFDDLMQKVKNANPNEICENNEHITYTEDMTTKLFEVIEENV